MLNISNIQRFSTGDGEGIRTTVFFKGCNLRCPWCHNPENITYEPVIMNYPDETKVCGKLLSAEDILSEILKDKDYYEASNGGVTFSGGECMLQAEKAVKLSKLIKNEGISLIVDTAGCVDYRCFELLNPYVDEYLYDIKAASQERHYDVIGGDFNLVYENLKKLLKDKKKVRIRIPLIPDFNTDNESIRKICKKICDLGITSADLLPFHRLGVGKYEALGLTYQYKDTKPFSAETLESIKNEYLNYINIKIEN